MLWRYLYCIVYTCKQIFSHLYTLSYILRYLPLVGLFHPLILGNILGPANVTE